jgi:hypothetical protein
MRTVFARTGGALTLFLAAAAAWGADPRVKPAVADEGGVHRMVIYNGAARTVHFLSEGLSPGDQAALRNLEMAENQVGLADQLLALRQQYVADERVLQAQRRRMQELLYGFNSSSSTSLAAGFGYPFGGYYGGFGGFSPYTSFPGYGGGLTGFASASGSESNTLAVGVGDEGAIKTAMAATLAGQATPEFAARAGEHLAMALDQAGRSPAIRTALRLPEKAPGVAFVGYETPGASVMVTRSLDGKSEKVEGTVVSSDANWLVLDTKEGRLTMNKSHIMDVLERGKK